MNDIIPLIDESILLQPYRIFAFATHAVTPVDKIYKSA